MIEVYYDGCCEPVNPGGNAGFGAIILEDGVIVKEISRFWEASPGNSNNVAEYLGLISAMEWLIENKKTEIKTVFYGDNMMSVKQMSEEWGAKKGLYLKHFKKAIQLKDRFKSLTFSWIPREENGQADDLSKRQLKNNGVQFKLQPDDELTMKYKQTVGEFK